MNTLSEIPPEVTGAANLVADWMKRNGHTRWELMEICSRNHAAELEQVQAKLAKISRVIDAMSALDDSMTDAQLAAESTLREAISLTVEADTAEQLAAAQHRNGLLLLQQAHEESIRAEMKTELVSLVAERDSLRADLKRAKDSEKCWVENAKNFDAARIKSEHQRDQWQTAATIAAMALRNCMGHISGEHPHWQAAHKAFESVGKLSATTDVKS